MGFNKSRRQQFITENYYERSLAELDEMIGFFSKNPVGSGVNEQHRIALGHKVAASELFNRFLIQYTAGEPIASLQSQIDAVVDAYEVYAESLRKYEGDPNALAFPIGSVDGYCPYVQLISLCYLLHRRDLLPRVAVLVDGPDGENSGIDWVVEELLSYAPMQREGSGELCIIKPYIHLADALNKDLDVDRLKELNRFLKRWYKDLAGAPWHDTHIPNAGGEINGYYGYWAFEAAAAVYLLEIEDDSLLHAHLYYPKDMVSFARDFASEFSNQDSGKARMRCAGGNPCPAAGWWWTPAALGAEHGRRYFSEGEIMPKFNSGYGDTIWQRDEDQ